MPKRDQPAMHRDAALRELRALAASLRRPLIADDLADQPRLLGAVRFHFGSFPAARRAAGLPDPPSEHRWSLPGLLRELRRLHRAGTGITREGLVAAGRRDLVAAAARLVGSVVKARELARIPGPSPYWTKERVLAALRDRSRTGEPIDAKLKGGARLCFGGLREAYAAAGLEPAHRLWTRGALLEELRAAGSGGVPRAVAHGCRQMFGSVAAARAAAGVRGQRRQWMPATVIAELRRSGGVAAGPLKKAAQRHFGSVQAARRAAGIVPKRETWSRTRVLDELRQIGARRPPAALIAASERHFGSLTNARLAAGVTPLRRAWSRADVLAEVRRAGPGALPPDVRSAARRFYGTITAARRAAGSPVRRRG